MVDLFQGFVQVKQTADELDKILTRLGLVGAIYLARLALLPNIFKH